MTHFTRNPQGQMEFAGGTQAWDLAERIALSCLGFVNDEEDEWVSEEPISCYNCRYRRWTPASFVCMGHGVHGQRRIDF